MNRKPSDWFRCVKMYVHHGVPMTKLAAKYQFDVSKLKYKVKVSLFFMENLLLLTNKKNVFIQEKKN